MVANIRRVHGKVAARRRAQEERNQAVALERVARVAGETVRAAAESAAHAKDEFLAELAHELRNPLNAIGWVRIARQAIHDKDKVAEGLAVIERNSVWLSRLVSDRLDVARIVTGKLELEVRPVLLAPLVKEAVDLRRRGEGNALSRSEGSPRLQPRTVCRRERPSSSC
jgi:signal transduction histidine kinase